MISPQPYNYGRAITTSDTVSIPLANANGSPMLAFSVGVAGNVVLVFKDATTLTMAVLAGTIYPFTCERINATSTTATGLIAWYRI